MPTAEDFRKKGYVYVGYFPPELSSADPYPPYIQAEVTESVKAIQSHQSHYSITFAFMTDMHYTPTYNHSIRLQRTIHAYKEIKKRTAIDKLILGGDLGTNGNKDFAAEAFREFRAHFGEVAYFPVLGNHDDNSIWDACIESEVSANYFTHDELYTLLFNHLPQMGARFDEAHPALYYLYDDVSTKTRYIFTDTNEVPEMIENGKRRYNGQHTFVQSQEQLNWLAHTALHFEEEGWSVVMAGHAFATQSNAQDDGSAYYLDPMRDIMNAFKAQTAVHKTYYEGDMLRRVDADFSNTPKTELICAIMGHYHKDAVEYGENGLPYILTAHGTMYDTENHKKYDGTKTEISFDVVTVDKKSRTIYITKVGDGEDRVVTY